MSRLRSWLALTLLAAPACTTLLGFGDPVELQGAGGSEEGGSAANRDGPQSGVDGGVDPRPNDEAVLPAFCENDAGAHFCSDFDPENDLVTKWTTNVSFAFLSRDTAASRAGPASLLASTQAGSGWRATAHKSFPEFAERAIRYELRFALRIDATDPAGALTALAEPFGLDGTQSTFAFSLSARQTTPTEVVLDVLETAAQNMTEYRLAGTFPIGTWIDLTFIVDVRSAAASFENRLKVLSGPAIVLDKPIFAPLGSGTPRLALGLGFIETPASARRIRYDNVAVFFSAF